MPIVTVLTEVFLCAFIKLLTKRLALFYGMPYSIDTGKGNKPLA